MDLSPIISELALKYNLSKKVIESISHSQWSFIKEKVIEQKYESILLQKLGKFAVKPNRLRLLYENDPYFRTDVQKHNRRLDKHNIPNITGRRTRKRQAEDLPPMQQEQT